MSSSQYNNFVILPEKQRKEDIKKEKVKQKIIIKTAKEALKSTPDEYFIDSYNEGIAFYNEIKTEGNFKYFK